MKKRFTQLARLGLVSATLALAACAGNNARPAAEQAATLPWHDAGQMIVVTSGGWDEVRGQMRFFERENGNWVQRGEAHPVMLGRAGAAWGIGLHPTNTNGPQKREGDGRNPAGVFNIGSAFGYLQTVQSGLAYQPMQASHWCMDVNDSPLYNQIVDSREVGQAAVHGSSEPMRLDIHNHGDDRYKYGFVIEHNAQNTRGKGSCIFAHLWGNPDKTTAGCTAMAEPVMVALLQQLDAKKRPVFVLLPEHEYDRQQQQWALPSRADFR